MYTKIKIKKNDTNHRILIHHIYSSMVIGLLNLLPILRTSQKETTQDKNLEEEPTLHDSK